MGPRYDAIRSRQDANFGDGMLPVMLRGRESRTQRPHSPDVARSPRSTYDGGEICIVGLNPHSAKAGDQRHERNNPSRLTKNGKKAAPVKLYSQLRVDRPRRWNQYFGSSKSTRGLGRGLCPVVGEVVQRGRVCEMSWTTNNRLNQS